MALDVSKAFDRDLHGALALLLRHMGSQRSSSSSSIPLAGAPQCTLSPHMAPPRASASTEA